MNCGISLIFKKLVVVLIFSFEGALSQVYFAMYKKCLKRWLLSYQKKWSLRLHLNISYNMINPIWHNNIVRVVLTIIFWPVAWGQSPSCPWGWSLLGPKKQEIWTRQFNCISPRKWALLILWVGAILLVCLTLLSDWVIRLQRAKPLLPQGLLKLRKDNLQLCLGAPGFDRRPLQITLI